MRIPSEEGEALRHGISRSSAQPRMERVHLELQPKCVCCKPGMHPNAGVQVHIFSFHSCIALGRPDVELDLRNLITQCENEPALPGENHDLEGSLMASFASSLTRREALSCHSKRGLASTCVCLAPFAQHARAFAQ